MQGARESNARLSFGARANGPARFSRATRLPSRSRRPASKEHRLVTRRTIQETTRRSIRTLEPAGSSRLVTRRATAGPAPARSRILGGRYFPRFIHIEQDGSRRWLDDPHRDFLTRAGARRHTRADP